MLVLAVAVLLAVAGAIYLSTQCQHLPAPLPGREAGSTRHRVGFAAAAFLLAALALVAAVVTRRPRPASR